MGPEFVQRNTNNANTLPTALSAAYPTLGQRKRADWVIKWLPVRSNYVPLFFFQL